MLHNIKPYRKPASQGRQPIPSIQRPDLADTHEPTSMALLSGNSQKTSQDVLRLQRIIGNQATLQLMRQKTKSISMSENPSISDRAQTPQSISIQRSLSIETSMFDLKGEFYDTVVNHLNELLQGTDVQASHTKGEVTLSGKPKDENDPRYRLLRDIIDHKRKIKIRAIKDTNNRTDVEAQHSYFSSKETKETNTVEEIKKAASTGTDAVVYYNPTIKQNVKVWDEKEKEAIYEPMPTFLILAHELIHAGRMQQGKAAFDPETGGKQEGVYKHPSGRLQIGALEEMHTVGLPPISDEEINNALEKKGSLEHFEKNPKAKNLLKSTPIEKDAVTENALRHVLGLKMRAEYETMFAQTLQMKGEKIESKALSKLGELGKSKGISKTKLITLLVTFFAIIWGIYYKFFSSSSSSLTGNLQKKPLDKSPQPQRILRTSMTKIPAPAPQPTTAHRGTSLYIARVFTASNPNWAEATKVVKLRTGVYEVRKNDDEALIVKTSADTGNPFDEAVASHVGRMLSVNTVPIQPHAPDSSIMKKAIETLSEIGGAGKELAQEIQNAETHILVMPYIHGKDLADAKEEWSEADSEQKQEWMQEIGRVWMLDVLLQNPDRHGENIRMGTDKKLHSIDQVVGPNMHKEVVAPYMGEKVKAVLDNYEEKKMFFLVKKLEINPDEAEKYSKYFDLGMKEVSEKIKQLHPEEVRSVYSWIAMEKVDVPLPGLEPVLKTLQKNSN